MNICIISSGTLRDSIPPIYGGGIQNYIYSISTYFSSKGHNVIIISGLINNLRHYELNNGIKIYRIKPIKNKLLSTISFSIKCVILLKKLIKKKEIQIIHTNSRVSTSFIRFFFPKYPIIFTEHNWDVIFTSIKFNLSIFLYFLKLFFELFSLNFASSVICLSKIACLRINAILSKSKKVKKVYRIPNVLNLNLLNVINNELDDGLLSQKYILYIGRLEKEKNLETLIDAFNKFYNKTKDTILYIIGNGTFYNNLLQKIKNQNLEKHIIIKRNIDNNLKYSYLKYCKFLILPSLFEIMPTVILEAYAFKKPVIASLIPASRELVKHGSTGYLFSPKNSSQLSKIINKLINNEKKIQLLGENGFKLLKDNFSVDIHYKNFLRVYRNIMR
ncbi:MAG: glycosyltransferase family 4 protein [Candidatus Helarchaeota archaeon]